MYPVDSSIRPYIECTLTQLEYQRQPAEANSRGRPRDIRLSNVCSRVDGWMATTIPQVTTDPPPRMSQNRQERLLESLLALPGNSTSPVRPVDP